LVRSMNSICSKCQCGSLACGSDENGVGVGGGRKWGIRELGAFPKL